MTDLLHGLLFNQANLHPDRHCLSVRKQSFSYGQLAEQVQQCAQALIQHGLATDDRVVIYLPKQLETVVGMFGTAAAGGCFVPANPLLKAAQLSYILADAGAEILITSSDRLASLVAHRGQCPALKTVILVDAPARKPDLQGWKLDVGHWLDFIELAEDYPLPVRLDIDLAAILYTSGSTGRPKGVVLSHRNMVCGAHSVASYLCNSPDDRILAVLPFSFDYGLSQLTTAFSVGASVVLMDYLLPRDVIKAVLSHGITGLAAVPPLWIQLAALPWPEEAAASLRYITNSGGAMPVAITEALRQQLPHTQVYLMYGLTEAFRSTYLDPALVTERPESMGKAIPNARISVVREDGSECDANEIGELVHRGALVAQGYWNDVEKTTERFRPAPGQPAEIPITEIAVWSGDQVRRDEDGFLYFVGRKDEMIKTSGYRVSPSEVEEVLYNLEMVAAAVAMGISHPSLGQGILVVVEGPESARDALLDHCRQTLPNFMVPHQMVFEDSLPRNPNGKIDRKLLAQTYQDIFTAAS